MYFWSWKAISNLSKNVNCPELSPPTLNCELCREQYLSFSCSFINLSGMKTDLCSVLERMWSHLPNLSLQYLSKKKKKKSQSCLQKGSKKYPLLS